MNFDDSDCNLEFLFKETVDLWSYIKSTKDACMQACDLKISLSRPFHVKDFLSSTSAHVQSNLAVSYIGNDRQNPKLMVIGKVL